jgi:hypothetical protein
MQFLGVMEAYMKLSRAITWKGCVALFGYMWWKGESKCSYKYSTIFFFF